MIIRVFPRRTAMTPRDDWAFVGDPPMLRPDATEVHVSCTFTWDMPEATRLAQAWGQYYDDVKLGGPAFGTHGNGFVPGVYVKEGVTFTSRGCNNHCPWCLVPQREGKLKELPIVVGNIVQDNNLLQCSRGHIDGVMAMLKTQRTIQFAGGLDAQLLTQDIADQIRGLQVYQVFLACDTPGVLKHLRWAVKRLQMPQQKVRCYVLIGFDGETVNEATARLEDVWGAGAMPFAQLYQPPDKHIKYSREWRHLAWVWSRPAAMKAAMRDKEANDI